MTALTETLRRPPAGKARRGNRRPKLLAPRLQTLFALPPRLLMQRAKRRLLQPLYRSRLYGSTLGKRSSGELAAIPTEIWPADARGAASIFCTCMGQELANAAPLTSAELMNALRAMAVMSVFIVDLPGW